MTRQTVPSGRLLSFVGWSCAALLAAGAHAGIGFWLLKATAQPIAARDDAGFAIVEIAELPAVPEADREDLPPAPESAFQEPAPEPLDERFDEALVEAELAREAPLREVSEPEEAEEEVVETITDRAAEPGNTPPLVDTAPEPEEAPEQVAEQEADPVPAPEEPELRTEMLPALAAPLPPARPPDLAPAPVRRQARPRAASVDSVAGAAPVAPAPQAVAPRPGRNAASASDLPPSWRARLAAHLERHRRYPQAARASGRQGVAHLRFTIDRAGNVLDHQIVRTSGSADLDDAAIAMVRRASPVPSLPAGAPDRLSLTVPVRFEVR